MLFLAVMIWVIPFHGSFDCRNQALVIIRPAYLNDWKSLKTIIAVLSPGTLLSLQVAVLIGLLICKLNRLFHCVIKQFFNSPA